MQSQRCATHACTPTQTMCDSITTHRRTCNWTKITHIPFCFSHHLGFQCTCVLRVMPLMRHTYIHARENITRPQTRHTQMVEQLPLTITHAPPVSAIASSLGLNAYVHSRCDAANAMHMHASHMHTLCGPISTRGHPCTPGQKS